MSTQAKTLFEKVWNRHLVVPGSNDTPATLYIDLHLIHEVSSPQAFTVLRERGLSVRQPGKTLATLDHSTPTVPGSGSQTMSLVTADVAKQIQALQNNCAEFGISLYDLDSEKRGIVHVIGPEQGLTRPGMTIVCGDSHTSTHGAFGAFAFGIGTTEVAHVLATQCLLQNKPASMAINITGALADGVCAKDLILAIIGKIGVGGGIGHVIEYRGETIDSLSMEQRMTICNMSIEAGARAGMIAPDQVTFEYLEGRTKIPAGASWSDQLKSWQDLPSDTDAVFDRQIEIDTSELRPMITFGTNPGMVISIDDCIPEKGTDESLDKALAYMGLEHGQPLLGHKIDIVFIGSCTNARISDLRDAATLLKGRKIARGIRVLVVPGSQAIKKQAEAEGLAQIFIEAGAEWRESGCSMCIAMNGDAVPPGQYVLSTSNRNFAGRQGSGARSILASPLTAAATAINGKITDPVGLM
jgi:3-isopropylmalate/(R)-2-methylmalate dehydratase large subunit